MYIIMLVVGLGFLVVTAAVGELFDLEGTHFSFMRPSVLAAALATAGAIGTFMGGHIHPWMLLPVSLAVGFVVGFLLQKLVLEPLHRAQNTSTVAQDELIGMEAVVDSLIPQEGFGRITYTVHGSRMSGPAKTVDGGGLSAGEQVVISRIEDKTFFVKKAEQGDEPGKTSTGNNVLPVEKSS